MGEVLSSLREAVPSPDVVLLATSVRYGRDGPARGAASASDLPILGASALSVATEAGWRERGVAGMALRSDAAAVRRGRIDRVAEIDPEAFAERWDAAVPRHEGGTEVLFFADAGVSDWAERMRALHRRRPDVRAYGACSVFDTGLAPGDRGFLENWQWFGGEALAGSLVFAAFPSNGGFRVVSAVRHGLAEIGRPARVTRSRGAVIETIDDRPAAEHFRRYIGDGEPRLDGYGNLVAFAVSRDDLDLRTPQYSLPLVFHEDGSVRTLAAVPEGSRIALTSASRTQLIDAAREAGRAVRASAGGRPDAVLVFSCAGREVALGGRCAEEIRAVSSAFEDSPPLFAMYSGQEFAPESSGGPVAPTAYSATVVGLRGAAAGRSGK